MQIDTKNGELRVLEDAPTPFRTLGSFCGCGGLDWGFWKAGFANRVAFDIDPNCLASYYRNIYIPKENLMLGDIREIAPQVIARARQEEVNILIGGFPCKAYSMSGNRDISDPRGYLYTDYLNLVKELHPLLFVIENVKGILSMRHYSLSKSRTMQKTLDGNYCNILVPVPTIIQDSASKMGYEVIFQTMNSAYFGVPQFRERVIFIGVRRELGINPKTLFPIQNKSLKPYSVWQAIGDLENEPENEEFSHVFPEHKLEIVEALGKLRAGQSLYKNFTESWRRLNPNLPAPVVKGNHNASSVHPFLPRCITNREMARLQGFCDDFLFIGSKRSVEEQIGNAVPPLFSYAIAKRIYEQLWEKYKKDYV